MKIDVINFKMCDFTNVKLMNSKNTINSINIEYCINPDYYTIFNLNEYAIGINIKYTNHKQGKIFIDKTSNFINFLQKVCEIKINGYENITLDYYIKLLYAEIEKFVPCRNIVYTITNYLLL